MPFTRLFYHIIWSTKNRLPLIIPGLENSLYAYFRQKATELECQILAVNGWGDHIHVIIEIPPKLSIAQVIKRLKGASSHEFSQLYWQRSYGALTVSERNLQAAIDYVNNQKEHHIQQTAIAKLEHSDDDTNAEIHGLRDERGMYKSDTQELF